MPLDALPLAAPVRSKLKEGWAKLAIAARPPLGRRRADDPVERAALVVLALDGLASLHAAAYGAAPVRAKLKEGWARLAVAAWPQGRREASDAPERAALVALALDRLAGASLHAAAYGTPREVEVPDETTAAIFRAALVLTAARRGTDRLVRIVVRPTGAAS